ncbi:Efflux pump dotC [Penicillium chermesinum]|nr:Efflux pump dotC [Penicillium chermesinum]
MATEALDHDASSEKTVSPDHDKSVEAAVQNPEKEQESKGADHAPDKEASGAPLAPTGSQNAKMGKKQIVVVMTALCLALFLAALDMTIVSTALVSIAADFNASASGYSWIASSYLLANAACIPLWGGISNIFGRKKVIILAAALFLVGSLICALARNLPMILSGRSIQGIGSGGIIILCNICVSDLFSVRERPMYFGLFGATWAIAGGLGPIIGGAFTTSVTWRWCFYLNLPIGGLSLVILIFFLHIESPKTPFFAGLRSIDWIGTFLIIGGTLMFLFGLEFGGVNYPWASPTVICLIVFGVVTWGLAMIVEAKFAKFPVIPARLFGEWYNVLVLLICFCHGFVFISGTYYLPLYFQTVLLASPILSGVYLLPMVLSLAVVSSMVGVLMNKTGRYREFIMFGLFMMTLGWGLFIDLKPYPSWPRIIIYQLIGGIGVGPNFQAPLVALQSNIRPSDTATATATFGFVRQLSTSKVVLDAFTFALSRMWIFYTAVAGVGLVLSCFVRARVLSKTHTIQKTGLAEQERARQELIASDRKDKPDTEV